MVSAVVAQWSPLHESALLNIRIDMPIDTQFTVYQVTTSCNSVGRSQVLTTQVVLANIPVASLISSGAYNEELSWSVSPCVNACGVQIHKGPLCR